MAKCGLPFLCAFVCWHILVDLSARQNVLGSLGGFMFPVLLYRETALQGWLLFLQPMFGLCLLLMFTIMPLWPGPFAVICAVAPTPHDCNTFCLAALWLFLCIFWRQILFFGEFYAERWYWLMISEPSHSVIVRFLGVGSLIGLWFNPSFRSCNCLLERSVIAYQDKLQIYCFIATAK